MSNRVQQAYEAGVKLAYISFMNKLAKDDGSSNWWPFWGSDPAPTPAEDPAELIADPHATFSDPAGYSQSLVASDPEGYSQPQEETLAEPTSNLTPGPVQAALPHQSQSYAPYQVPGQQFPGVAEAGRGTASNFTAVKGGYGKQLAALKQHFAANGQADALDGLTYQDMARAMGNRGLRPGDRFDADALLQNMQAMKAQDAGAPVVQPLAVQRMQGRGDARRYQNIGTFQTLQQQRAAATRNSAKANVNPYSGLRGAGAQKHPNFTTSAGAPTLNQLQSPIIEGNARLPKISGGVGGN